MEIRMTEDELQALLKKKEKQVTYVKEKFIWNIRTMVYLLEPYFKKEVELQRKDEVFKHDDPKLYDEIKRLHDKIHDALEEIKVHELE